MPKERLKWIKSYLPDRDEPVLALLGSGVAAAYWLCELDSDGRLVDAERNKAVPWEISDLVHWVYLDDLAGLLDE